MPPPLMRLSIWTRVNGRLAAMMFIAFTTWSGFQSWVYWVQVCVLKYAYVQWILTDLATPTFFCAT